MASRLLRASDGSTDGWNIRTVRARADVTVWERGTGTAVLLVHGFPDHPIGLLDFAQAIVDQGYRCVLPALPGFWPSEKPSDGDYSSSAINRDLLCVLDELDITQGVYVGHDWGAEFGYPLVAANPTRFAHYIALATPHPAGYLIRRKVFSELRTAWYAFFLGYAPHAHEIARDSRWLTALVQSWSPGLHWEKWPAVQKMLMRSGVMEAVCSYYRANLDGPLSAPVIETATTTIHGGQDGCISPTAYSDFSPYFPGGYRDVLIPGVGHWPHLEAPGETAEAILQALEGCRT